jgi:hypothetical protein
MKSYKFYKESNRWFIYLPEWKGNKEDLEMVEGADTMLDIISQGESPITLFLSIQNDCYAYPTVLEKLEECDSIKGGAYYLMKEYNGIEYNLKLWLCDVTLFVFNEFPEKIYIL